MKFVKTITLLMTFCVMAFGNNDRINALGGNAGFWPEDDANVTSFPAMVNSLDMVQVTGAGNSNGTATVIWGDETTWGFKFDGANDSNNNDWLNLMWGNGTYGTTFSLGMGSTDNGDVATSNMGLGVGFGMNMNFGEIGVLFSNNTFDDGNDDTEEEGTTHIGFNLRRAQDLWLFDNMLVNFSMDMTTNAGNQKDYKNDDMNFSVDLFTALPVGDGVAATFAMGFGFMSNTETVAMMDEDGTADGSEDISSSVFTLPSMNLGIEADVTDWATVRFGVGHSYVLAGTKGDFKWSGAQSLVETAGYVDTSTEDMEFIAGDAPEECTTCVTGISDVPTSNFDWNFGLGFDYGSFTLDMVLENTNLFNDPVRYVTGRNNIALSSSATLTWNF